MPRDYSSILPSAVRVIYPIRYCDNTPNPLLPNYPTEIWTEEVPITAVPAVAAYTGHPGAKTLHDTAQALMDSPGSTEPTNRAALSALARRVAIDFYGWQAGNAEERNYIGVISWEMDGQTDGVVWAYDARECSTRIIADPWNGQPEELLHTTCQVCGESASASSGSGSSASSESGSPSSLSASSGSPLAPSSASSSPGLLPSSSSGSGASSSPGLLPSSSSGSGASSSPGLLPSSSSGSGASSSPGLLPSSSSGSGASSSPGPLPSSSSGSGASSPGQSSSGASSSAGSVSGSSSGIGPGSSSGLLPESSSGEGSSLSSSGSAGSGSSSGSSPASSQASSAGSSSSGFSQTGTCSICPDGAALRWRIPVTGFGTTDGICPACDNISLDGSVIAVQFFGCSWRADNPHSTVILLWDGFNGILEILGSDGCADTFYYCSPEEWRCLSPMTLTLNPAVGSPCATAPATITVEPA